VATFADCFEFGTYFETDRQTYFNFHKLRFGTVAVVIIKIIIIIITKVSLVLFCVMISSLAFRRPVLWQGVCI